MTKSSVSLKNNIYTMIVNFQNTAAKIQIRLKTHTRRDNF